MGVIRINETNLYQLVQLALSIVYPISLVLL